MTYCVAAIVDEGICFVSDSRTNAGIDSASTYSKMHTFGIPGESQFVILSAGNLATTQRVISQVKRDMNQSTPGNLLSLTHVSDAAGYLGDISLSEQQKHKGGSGVSFEASFIVGGQIRGTKPGAYLVYPQGNYIKSSKDTPYLQIGETKYGKPILDRIIARNSSLETAALACLVSMDSTTHSNLTVGPPIEVLVYERNSFHAQRRYRYEENSEYLKQLKISWDAELKKAFSNLPPIAWSATWDSDPGDQNAV